MTSTTLTAELAAVRNELNRVDAKCGTLTGLTGAGLTYLATRTGHGPIPVQALTVLAGLGLAAATITLLSVLRPRLGPTGFRRYLDMNLDEIERLADLEPLVIEAEDLQVLSRIVNAKYEALRRAVDLTIGAAGLVLLALLAGVVA